MMIHELVRGAMTVIVGQHSDPMIGRFRCLTHTTS